MVHVDTNRGEQQLEYFKHAVVGADTQPGL